MVFLETSLVLLGLAYLFEFKYCLPTLPYPSPPLSTHVACLLDAALAILAPKLRTARNLRLFITTIISLMISAFRLVKDGLISYSQHSQFSFYLELFTNDCRILSTQYSGESQQRNEPIAITSDYTLLVKRAGKLSHTRCDGFWFGFSLAKKLARDF